MKPINNMKTGIELIAIERQEQIEKHKRTIEQDVLQNRSFQLLDAATGLLSKWPDERDDIVSENENERGNTKGLDHIFRGLVPEGWSKEIWEKMFDKPYKERLIIAAALIAAEVDRLQNL